MDASQQPPPPVGDGTPPTGSPAPASPYPATAAPGGQYAGSTSAGAGQSGQYAGSPYTGSPPTGTSAGSQYTGAPYTGGGAGGGTSTGSPPPGTSTATGFFDSIRGSGMVRPDHRVVAGVGAAVAGRLRIDPLLVRVGFVVLTLAGGVGVLAYGLGWLLLPQQDGRIHAQALLAGSVTAGTVGAGLTTLVGIGGFGPPWTWNDRGPDVGGIIALAAIVFVIVLFVVGNQQGWFGSGRGEVGPAYPGDTAATRVDLSKPGTGELAGTSQGSPAYPGAAVPPVPPTSWVPPAPPVPPRPRRRTAGPLGTLLAMGLALLAAGTVVVADSMDPLSADVAVVAWAGALAVLAACLLMLGLAGRRSGGLGLIAVVALLGVTATSIATEVTDSENVGQRRWVPTGQLDSYQYRLSAGEAVLDLRQLTVTSGPPVDVEADVSLGELVVRVPDDLTVAMDVTVGVGDVTGVAEGQSVIGPDGPVDANLAIDVSVGSLVLQEVSR